MARRRFQSHRSSSVSCSKKWDRKKERQKQRERKRSEAILYLCFPRNWRWRRSNFPGGNHSELCGTGCLTACQNINGVVLWAKVAWLKPRLAQSLTLFWARRRLCVNPTKLSDFKRNYQDCGWLWDYQFVEEKSAVRFVTCIFSDDAWVWRTTEYKKLILREPCGHLWDNIILITLLGYCEYVPIPRHCGTQEMQLQDKGRQTCT